MYIFLTYKMIHGQIRLISLVFPLVSLHLVRDNDSTGQQVQASSSKPWKNTLTHSLYVDILIAMKIYSRMSCSFWKYSETEKQTNLNTNCVRNPPYGPGTGSGISLLRSPVLRALLTKLISTTLRRVKCSIINRYIFIFLCPLLAIAFKWHKWHPLPENRYHSSLFCIQSRSWRLWQ